MTPDTALDAAFNLVYGDRGDAYGHPAEDFARTGRMWGAILGTGDIPPEKVAMMLICVKLSRLTATPGHRDSAVDIAGYAECLAVIQERNEL